MHYPNMCLSRRHFRAAGFNAVLPYYAGAGTALLCVYYKPVTLSFEQLIDSYKNKVLVYHYMSTPVILPVLGY